MNCHASNPAEPQDPSRHEALPMYNNGNAQLPPQPMDNINQPPLGNQRNEGEDDDNAGGGHDSSSSWSKRELSILKELFRHKSASSWKSEE